jgi:hypothetical protein
LRKLSVSSRFPPFIPEGRVMRPHADVIFHRKSLRSNLELTHNGVR